MLLNADIAGRNPVVCQFSSSVDSKRHKRIEAILLEGKYWKRRINAVKEEYKKWRMFHRKSGGSQTPSRPVIYAHSEPESCCLISASLPSSPTLTGKAACLAGRPTLVTSIRYSLMKKVLTFSPPTTMLRTLLATITITIPETLVCFVRIRFLFTVFTYLSYLRISSFGNGSSVHAAGTSTAST